MKNKRFISMILAITLILGIVPTNVFATQGDTYSIDNVYSEYEKDADTDDYEEELGGETDENSNENAELSSYRQQSAFSVFMQEKMVEYKSLKEAQSTEDENSTEEANPPQATLSVMPIAGNEAEITGGSTYTTLEAAVTDATSGDTIKLLADVELELALSISEEITLDLNGFDIKQTEEYSVISITSSGNLTLEDNGSRADRYGYWDTSSGDYAIVANEADVPTDTDYTELQGGVIYGGIGTQSGSYKYGGGVYVTGGTFTMDGGNIAGNTARSGGGVYVENSGTFTMDGGTIAGNTATTNGMGVYISSSTFTMERGTISGNKTIGTSSSYGGGVYVYSSSTFTMNDGTISDNKTSYGGGVFISTSSTFAMKKGSIENNTASYGGVYVSSSSTFTMEDGIISYNTARSGGGVYVSDGTFIMEGGTISGNTATDSYGSGGGVYVKNGTFTMEDGTISNNTTTGANSDGGGVYVYSSTFTMNGGTVESNTAPTGNRIYLDGTSATFYLKISNTLTSSINGALYTDDDDNFDMTVLTDGNVTIDGGTATSKSKDDIAYFTGETWTFDPLEAETGGVKYTTLAEAVSKASAGGTVTLIKDVEISSALSIDKKITLDLNGFDIQQTGTNESVISITSTGNLTLADTSTLSDRVRYGYWDVSSGDYTIVANATDVPTGTDSTELQGGIIYGGSASNGAGVYVNSSSTFAMNGGNIVGNKATDTYGYGGGVYVNSGTFTMSGGTISDNTATDTYGYGGGVYVNNGAFTMNGGTISNNEASSNGGGVYVSGLSSAFIMKDGTISNNEASSGGGVYSHNGAFTMSGGTISDNIATTYYGGGVTLYNGGTFTMSGGTISGNKAVGNSSSYGGGVYVNGSIAFNMKGGTISNNEAISGGGVYVTNNSSTFTMSDGTIKNNTATTYSGGGVYVNSGTFTMNGGTIEDNTATTGDRIYLAGTSAIFKLYISPTLTSSIKGALYTDDADNFDMTVRTNNSYITIDNGTATSKSKDNIAYFTGETWTFDPPEAEINGTSYFTLEKAVASANTDDTITLLADVTLKTKLTISDTITIDLNGFDIKQTGTNESVISVVSGGNLTLEDNGTRATRYGYWDTTYEISDTTPSVDYTTLQGGVIYGGSATDGAGVYVDGGTFAMTGGNIVGNKATSGGGVYVNSGTFEMTGGTVESNTATNGDRIYLAGVNAIFNLNISPMTSLATIKGALYTNDDDNFDMTVHTDGNVTIDNGTATSKSANDTVYFTGETWTFNPIEAKIGSTTYFTLENALAAANANDTITLLADVTLENQLEINKTLTIDLNGFDIKQTGSTRVISIDLGSNFTLVDSNPNSRTRYGYWDTTYKITDTYNADYTVLEGGIIYGGSSTMGAGVYVNSKDTFTMNGGNIAGNNADNNSGGGVYVDGGTFNMKGGSITGNSTSTYGSGGGVYVNGGTFTMKNGIITENKTKNGAGVYVDGGYFAMEDSTISKNIASYSYGGVCVYKSTFIMTSGTIEYNTASGSSGGGVGVNNSTFTMNGGTINNNTATTTDGGGVYVYYGTFIMNDGAINNNTATTNGGGVYNTSSTFTMNSGTIEYNTADYGGGVYISYENFLMNGGTITNNTATTNGGGVYVSSASSAKLSLQGEVIISGNTSNSNPDNVYLTNKKNIQLSGALIGSSLVGITSATTTAGTTVVSSDGYTLQTTDNEKFFYDDGSRAIILDTTTNVLKLATSLIDSMVTGIQDEEYTGSTLETTVIVTDGSVLTVDVDYEVSYSTETQAGDTVTVTITGIGNYGGTVTKTFTITKATLSASDFSFTAPSDLTYDGNEKSATVTNANIVGGGKITLTYTSSSPSYSSTTPPTDVGTYEVTVSVTGDNNYNDILSLADSWTFTIVPLEVSVEWTNTELYYTGSDQAPTATVSNYITGDDVTIGVSGAETNVGSYTATIVSPLLGTDSSNYTLPATLPTTIFTINSTPLDFESYINGLDTKKSNGTLTFDDIRNVQTWYDSLNSAQKLAIDVYDATLKTDLDAYTDTIPANITVDVASGKDNIYVIGDSFDPTDFVVTVTQTDSNNIVITSDDVFKIPSEALDGSNKLVEGTHIITIEYDKLSTTIQIIVLEKYSISGIIYDSNNQYSVNTDVKLIQSGSSGSSATTNSDGEFDFGKQLAGIYNLVIEYTIGSDTITQTILVVLDKDTELEIKLPVSGKNSFVEITTGTPVLAVGNVDEIAREFYINPTDTVDVLLKVEYLNTADATIVSEKLDNETLGLWLDISLEYELGSVGYYIGIDVASSLIEVVIELPLSMQGQKGYAVYREHDGEIHKIYTTKNSDGEYISVSGNYLTLHTKKFSTYAIAYASSVITAPSTSGGSSGGSGGVIITPTKPSDYLVSKYLDVSITDWFYSDVHSVTDSGYMNGIGNSLFDPYGYTTRAMLATMVYRLEGLPMYSSSATFTDVNANTWYTDAIYWGAENAILNGYNESTFGTEDNILRQDVAVILYRYAQNKNYDMDYEITTAKFIDEDEISEYAYEAMNWAVSNGLFEGNDNSMLEPKINASRAEIATVFTRLDVLIEGYSKN